MHNFTYYNSVKIIFGKDSIESLKHNIPMDKKVLIVYGGGSIKRNGIYDKVKNALNGYTTFEFAGIEPNPQYETLMKAAQIVRQYNIDFILAVGGGSVIDGTKFISAASNFVGDPWDIVANKSEISNPVPFGTVLTLPAAGSEMNSFAVISKGIDKLAFGNDLLFPKFSILDPTTTFSLPSQQTSNGIIDSFVHVMEQYLTFPVNSPLQDRMAESILLTLIEESTKVFKYPTDYAVRANLMWASSMALNSLIGVGVPEDWTTHSIGHEITALYNLDHAQTLAIVLPAVMYVQRKQKMEKLSQYAERIWGIKEGNSEYRTMQAIEKTRLFFESLGVKTHLRDYGISAECINLLIKQLERHGMIALGEHQDIDLVKSEEILQLCL
jgi:NADP-dependent alcohol dehydrogenase